jgi:hypothetical protein
VENSQNITEMTAIQPTTPEVAPVASGTAVETTAPQPATSERISGYPVVASNEVTPFVPLSEQRLAQQEIERREKKSRDLIATLGTYTCNIRQAVAA